jgi:hypothetical protein
MLRIASQCEDIMEFVPEKAESTDKEKKNDD